MFYSKKKSGNCESEEITDIWSYDEASIRTETQPKKCVKRRNETVTLPIEKNYQKSWNIQAAINGLGEVLYRIMPGKQNKFEVVTFLKQVRRFNKYRPSVVTMDNYNTHRNQVVYDFAKEKKMFLHFQPTHSPFLNGMEELWRHLRRWLAHRFLRQKRNYGLRLKNSWDLIKLLIFKLLDIYVDYDARLTCSFFNSDVLVTTGGMFVFQLNVLHLFF